MFRRRKTWYSDNAIASTLWSGSVVVPTDYLGIHFHRWPNGNPLSPPPTFNYNLVRSHDYGPNGGSFGAGGINWSSINTANGIYNWNYLDEFINTHYNSGKSILYTLYGTPSWATTSINLDPYGQVGGAGNPTSQTSVSNFITALITRYNSGVDKKIKYLEIWNEPDFSGTGFWEGTASQLAILTKTVKTAAKAVDSTITILAPPFTNTNLITTYMSASNGAGGTGKDDIEGVGFHAYGKFGYWDQVYGPFNLIDSLYNDIRTAATAGGVPTNIPIYQTEAGYSFNSADPNLLVLTKQELANWAIRVSLAAATAGYKMYCFYGYDDNLFGNPSTSPVISNALNWIGNEVSGKTITSICLLNNGKLLVKRNTGNIITPY